MAAPRNFLGRGWSFPPEFTKPSNAGIASGAAMADGLADIEQSIRLILSTSPGERIMEPKFGCAMGDFLFRTVDLSMKTLIRNRVRFTLLHLEPRIVVDTVAVTVANALEGRMELSIDYTVRATNSRHNLVHPYCQLEGTLLKLP